MTRNVTTAFRISAESNFNPDVDLCFLTLSHQDFDEDIQLVWDTQDYVIYPRYFIGFPFELTILSDDENPPQARLAIQNVDPRIGDLIRALTSPPRIKIEIFPASDFIYNLLLHFDGTNGSTTFTDSGGLEWTIGVVAGPTIDTSQKLFGTGASGRFTGSGHLQVPADTTFVMGANSFTLDFSFRISATGTYVFWDSGNGQFQVRMVTTAAASILDESAATIVDESAAAITDSGGTNVIVRVGGTDRITSATSVALNTWYHVEVVRLGTTLRLFFNGVQEGGDYTDATVYTDNDPTIGSDNAGASPFNGWMDELRFINGIPMHETDFDVPLTPYIPNTTASDTPIYIADRLFLVNVTVDVIQVTGTIVGWDYLQRVWPGQRATQARFPGLFR